MSEETEIMGDTISEDATPVENVQDESSQATRQVPLDALQAERAQRQALQDEIKIMKDHLALMQANQSQPKEKPMDDFDGLSEDDVLTVKDLKKALKEKEKQFSMTIQELRMTQKYPDYQDVVTKYLPEVLKQNPGLQNTLINSQDYELAYYLAKNSDSYKKESKKATKNADAQRIVENSSKVGSLSSIGTTSPISEAKKYKTMSDAEFRKLSQQNLGYY